MGSMSKPDSFALLDAFADAGGNFIDTANNYQDEQSETWIGEWMAARKNRDRIILATKFTTPYRDYELGKAVAPNYSGNHKKSMQLSLRDSLRKLQTDYVDILYLHWWDHSTSIEELMDSLHLLVQQGKVLYLGISDTPAWIVSAANEYARAHAKTPFSIYQGRWNVMRRDFERDVLPMARHYGMALAPWDVIGGGKFQTAAQVEARKKQGESLRNFFGSQQSEEEIKVSAALEKVAKELGDDYSISGVALAYVMAKAPKVFPIVGGRKVEHLKDNIKALTIKLSREQIKALEAATPFDIGFPGNFLGAAPKAVLGMGGGLLAGSAFIDWTQTEKSLSAAGEVGP